MGIQAPGLNAFEHVEEQVAERARLISLDERLNDKNETADAEVPSWFEKAFSFLNEEDDPSASSNPDDDLASHNSEKPSEETGYRTAVSESFRDSIGESESGGDYSAVNDGAYGKYQLRIPALKDAGYVDDDGNWTGKDGIMSEEDFLNNPEVQDNAFDEYMEVLDGYLDGNGSYDHLGTEFSGVLGEGIVITENGLVAAAHRAGAGAVAEYLEWQMENNWPSDFPPHLADKFKWIETRLRKFQDVD